MFLSEWREFRSAPSLAGKKNDDSSRLDVEIVRVPVCFRACVHPGRAKDLSAPRYIYIYITQS